MITLTKDMETGVPLIDSQHRELVDRINAVTAMGTKSTSVEETKRTLDLLGNYIVTHFNDEEELQKKAGYPKYKEHQAQHKYYINEFQKLKQEFEKNGSSPKFTLELSNSIIAWIVRHIKSEDVALGKFLSI